VPPTALVPAPAEVARANEAHASEARSAQASVPEQRRTAAPALAPREAVPREAAPREAALEAETRLIEQALRAARAGDRDRALAWLAEHQRLYPNGALAPERQRALERLQH